MNKQELKDYIKSLPPLPHEAKQFTWLDRRITLRENILDGNPDDFLSWAVIQSTMNTDYKSQHNHIDKWESETGLSISTLKTIVEFGGGYGAMLKCFRERNFTGSYYGYDFPEFLALQAFYTGEEISRPAERGEYDLFISICGLSEASMIDRTIFIKNKLFTHYLVRYQHDWDGINNHIYFSDIEATRIKVDDDRNHYYLLC